MKLPILAYGHPLLRKKSIDIEKGHEGLSKIIADMYDTMYASNGVGLAAPQVGLNIRLIVLDLTPYVEDYKEALDFKKVMINTHITEVSGDEWIFNEGCLSVPEVREDIIRKSNIHITYYDENFNFHEEDLFGINARVVQHEYDHLEGVLFVDKVSPLKKVLLKRKLTDISKGYIKPAYKMIYPAQKKKHL
jgi:peptide deformylase